MFIAPHRKACALKGQGIQYIPGHTDSFVDHVVNNYVMSTSNVLDLGGGGFRFAVPAARIAKSVDVVDNDETSLDIESIINHARKNDNNFDMNNSFSNIKCHCSDLLYFLSRLHKKYDLITSFRVIHFFSESEINTFISSIKNNLTENGILALSFITPFDNGGCSGKYNEVYLETESLDNKTNTFRKFRNTGAALGIMQCQNLAEQIAVIDPEYFKELCQNFNFECIEGPIQSTRVVEGFILRAIKDTVNVI
jgi:2-polyprenyl-3-methyl-5-hydroxy-6-metoxy-1,4-benzoquinol methylase